MQAFFRCAAIGTACVTISQFSSSAAADSHRSISVIKAEEILSSTKPVVVPSDVQLDIIPFSTGDLTNFSALLGHAPMPALARKAQIALYKPSTTCKGVVLITPGSEGVRDKLTGQHVRNFLAMSYAVGVVDSYSCRGVSNVLNDQTLVSIPTQVLDIALAIKTISSRQPYKQLPIGLFGTSRGGMVINFLLDRRLLKVLGINRPINWACVLYPTTEAQYDPKTINPIALPFLFIVAEKDDEVSPHNAVDFARRLKDANGSLKLIVWPNAAHLFDAPFSKTWFAHGLSVKHAPLIIVGRNGTFSVNNTAAPTWDKAVRLIGGYITEGIHAGNTDSSNTKVLGTIQDFLKSIYSR